MLNFLLLLLLRLFSWAVAQKESSLFSFWHFGLVPPVLVLAFIGCRGQVFAAHLKTFQGV